MSLLAPTPSPLTGPVQPAPGTIIPMPPGVLGDGSAEPVIQPFETSLQLSADRLEWLVDRTMTRMEEVAREMGRQPDGHVQPESWMWIREKNQASYDKNLEWRQAISSVFAKSNFTLGDSNHFARLLAARVRSDLLGTRPFFGAFAVPGTDAKLAQQVEEYVQNRVDDSNIPDALREALRTALVRNEAVLKTTYLRDETPFVGPARVMVDERGQPVPTPARGFYIYENDDLVPDPQVEGLFRLQKDPSYSQQQGQNTFATFQRLEQKLTQYDNAHSQVLEFRDFLCPLKFNETWQADINVHLYETSPENLRGMYPDVDTADAYFQWRAGWSGAKRAKWVKGEDEEHQSQVLNVIYIAECYVRCDADGDGAEEEIVIVLDVTNRKAVFYDYLGNHMSRRPFSVVVGVEQELGRWYGIGVFSKMEHCALYADAQFNRINDKDSRNSTGTFRHPNAVKQWKNGGPVVLGTDQVYDIDPSWDPAKPPIFRINLQENAQLSTEQMALMRQSAAVEFGAIDNATASARDLNQSHTATGVMSSDRDSNVLTADTEIDIGRGIVDVLEIATELLLENMNPMEMQYSKDGDQLALLNRDEIRRLPRRVTLLLTKTRSVEMLQSNKDAEAIWMRYMHLTPPEQQIGRPIYLKMLKGLQIDDADDLLPEVTKKDADAWTQAQQQNQQPKPPNRSIATKYGDLARSEQKQLLVSEGITPAPDAEIGQMKTAALATKVTEKAASKAGTVRAPGSTPTQNAPAQQPPQ